MSLTVVVRFACVGTLERVYDVVLQHVEFSPGVVGTLASWFAISWRGGWVHARKFCEGGAKATLLRVLEHFHINGQGELLILKTPTKKNQPDEICQ